MGARETIQARIDAQQRYDAIEYGRRTLEWQARGRRWDARLRKEQAGGWIWAQLAAAMDAAEWLGETGATEAAGIEWRLRKAKKLAAADLLAAKAAEKAIGTKRQLRLALAA